MENYHTRESFKLLVEHNVLASFNNSERKVFRKRFIDCILATDMANHAKNMNLLKTKLEVYDIKEGNNVERFIDKDSAKNSENQQIILNTCIHSADVSNPAKPYIVYKKWVSYVFEEFFNQGDMEKKEGLPVTVMCDRETTSVCKAQIGFISFVVKPTFELIKNLSPLIQPYCDNIRLNQTLYEKIHEAEQNAKNRK